MIDPAFSLSKAPSWMKLDDVLFAVSTKLRDSENTIRSHNIFARTNPSSTQLSLGTIPFDSLRFVNPTGNDFQLMKGSVAIDAGTLVGESFTGLAGNNRPFGHLPILSP